jgi:hypothetical protein
MRKTILATASALAISIVPALAEMPGAPVGGGGHMARGHGYGDTAAEGTAGTGTAGIAMAAATAIAEAIGALTAPGFRGPLAGPFSAGPSLPGANARTGITWRATTPATPTDISSAGLWTLLRWAYEPTHEAPGR